ncbi:polysaccharide deacetylase family protein [Helicobacter saguini]|uniref:Polysaccharide deacetylase family protein n=1 Tax=Helicobacter saguini TaxID=1548018 RepID=A0A6L7DK41_9HELI|nr:polysaccharide deacetylase family protein [Helicobacter saguini]MWV70766.1 polysaccharide deacetylase family protein [Helicobacter saguini]
MKSIMYHYVQKSRAELPYFRYLDFSNFQKQLDFFESEYGFVEYDDFLALLDALLESNLDSKKIESIYKKMQGKILLTFDDGLKCHYEYVFGEFKKRNLFGLFFIPTGVYERSKALDVHRIHYLTGSIKSKDLYEYAKKITQDSMLEHREKFENTTYLKQDNDFYTQEFKRLFNYYIKYEFRESLLDNVVEHFCGGYDIFANYYLSESEIMEMDSQNMFIGSHSVNHFVLSKLNKMEQSSEIVNSFKLLEKVLESNLDSNNECQKMIVGGAITS